MTIINGYTYLDGRCSCCIRRGTVRRIITARGKLLYLCMYCAYVTAPGHACRLVQRDFVAAAAALDVPLERMIAREDWEWWNTLEGILQ